jgi:hypothetical protein
MHRISWLRLIMQQIQTLLPLCFIFGFGDVAEPYQYYNRYEEHNVTMTVKLTLPQCWKRCCRSYRVGGSGTSVTIRPLPKSAGRAQSKQVNQ